MNGKFVEKFFFWGRSGDVGELFFGYLKVVFCARKVFLQDEREISIIGAFFRLNEVSYNGLVERM